jgi:hypothetical protein
VRQRGARKRGYKEELAASEEAYREDWKVARAPFASSFGLATTDGGAEGNPGQAVDSDCRGDRRLSDVVTAGLGQQNNANDHEEPGGNRRS